MSITSRQNNLGHPMLVRGVAAIAAATAAALATWVVAVPIAGVELEVRRDGDTRAVGAAEVILTTVLAGLVAWGARALLERWTARPRRIWLSLAALVLLLTLAGPIGSAVTTGATLALIALHLVVGAILIAVLTPAT
jgi:hypothetical protein